MFGLTSQLRRGAEESDYNIHFSGKGPFAAAFTTRDGPAHTAAVGLVQGPCDVLGASEPDISKVREVYSMVLTAFRTHSASSSRAFAAFAFSPMRLVRTTA